MGSSAPAITRPSNHILGWRDEGGFSLLELLIVIVILGILAATVVYAVSSMGTASAIAACKADYKTVETAVGAYESQSDTRVTSINQLVGVWLKEPPTNSNGYVIGLDGNGDVTVQSVSPAHTAEPGNTNCAYA